MDDLRDKKRLLSAAKMIVEALRDIAAEAGGNCWNHLTTKTVWTGGWKVVIAGLGLGKPRFELWLDRYPNTETRRFYFGFYNPAKWKIKKLVSAVPEHLKPVAELTKDDFEEVEKHVWVLKKPLKASKFSQPIVEHYDGGSYFGEYDPITKTGDIASRQMVHRAVAFFEEVAQRTGKKIEVNLDVKIFPRCENREIVALHKRRERSPWLALEAKIRDNYKCRVCGMRFEEIYGEEYGRDFAEAHHIIPLSQLKTRVLNLPKDLVTVCSNCHRMLHKMDGVKGDVSRLKKIFLTRQQGLKN